MASKTRDSVAARTLSTDAGVAPTVAVANGSDTNLLDLFDVELMDRVEFGVQNTGGTAMVVRVWYQYVDGGAWYQDLGSGNAPSIAGGASARLAFPSITARRLRVTANGTGATTTAKIELHAAGYQ